MAEVRDRVVVLRHRPYRENDALVTAFGQSQGKLSAVARGVRSMKGHLAAGVQALTLAQWTLYQGRSSLMTVTQAEAERHYPHIRQDLERTARAAMLADLVDELWSEHDADRAAFRLLEEGLAGLEGGRPPAALFLAGLWQLLREGGFKPDFAECSACGAPLGDGPAGWRAATGPLCARCRAGSDAVIPPGGLAWLRRAELLPPDRLGTVVASRRMLNELERQAHDYVVYHLGRVPRAFRFWDQIAPHWPEEGESS